MKSFSVNGVKTLKLGLGVVEDFLLPPSCYSNACVGKRWGRLPLCKTCLRKLWLPEDRIAEGKIEDESAGEGVSKDFDYLGNLFVLSAEFSKILYGFKYQGQRRNGIFLAHFLRFASDLKEKMKDYDFLVPVPLHSLKKRERGYNQSEVIANIFSIYLKLPVKPNFLKRIQYTKTQTQLGRKKRMKNIQKSIAPNLKHIIPGSKVLLIDDVLTTGSTLSVCANTLRSYGIEQIGAVTLAQSLKNQKTNDFLLDLELAGGFAT